MLFFFVPPQGDLFRINYKVCAPLPGISLKFEKCLPFRRVQVGKMKKPEAFQLLPTVTRATEERPVARIGKNFPNIPDPRNRLTANNSKFNESKWQVTALPEACGI